MNSSLIDRFRESMIMNRERWHDGTGYDLSLLAAATLEERARIESLLISRGIRDWRDVEALASLDTPGARDLLRQTFESGDTQTRAMVLARAPELFGDDARTEAIVAVLVDEDAESRLIEIMLEVEEYHPPRVVEALLKGVCARDAITAGEFAMMLLFIHGEAESPWDMAPRPFILRFQDEEREPLYRELCERIGLSPETTNPHERNP